jgi:hypothetical protein
MTDTRHDLFNKSGERERRGEREIVSERDLRVTTTRYPAQS